MMISSEGKAHRSKMILPIGLMLVGFSLIVYAVPGEGKNIPNAIGLALVFPGVFWTIVTSRKSK